MAKKYDKQKLFTRIIAAILVLAMVLGVCATIIYTLFAN